jgi:hypothetical protein
MEDVNLSSRSSDCAKKSSQDKDERDVTKCPRFTYFLTVVIITTGLLINK